MVRMMTQRIGGALKPLLIVPKKKVGETQPSLCLENVADPAGLASRLAEGSQLLFGGRPEPFWSIHPKSIRTLRLDRDELLPPRDCRPIRFHRRRPTVQMLIAPIPSRLVSPGDRALLAYAIGLRRVRCWIGTPPPSFALAHRRRQSAVSRCILRVQRDSLLVETNCLVVASFVNCQCAASARR